jgi:hypothetical protein
VGADWRIILKWILRNFGYEIVNWAHKRPMTSFLKGGRRGRKQKFIHVLIKIPTVK